MTKQTISWKKYDEHQAPFSTDVELTEEELCAKASIEIQVNSLFTSKPLNPFELDLTARVAVAMTMENCIDELFILKALLREPIHGSCLELFKYRTLRERFAITPKAKMQMEQEKFEKIRYTDCQKMRDDVCFIFSTLKETTNEILDTGMFTILLTVILSAQQQDHDTTELESSAQHKRSELNYLMKLLVEERENYELELHEVMDTILKLQHKEEDLLAYNHTQKRYLEAWENSRQEQNDTFLNEKEDELNQVIKGNQTMIDIENRIHTEIQNFIAENTDDLQDGILYWMRHYDQEVERRDAEIYRLKMTWEALGEEHVKLIDKYEEHKTAIEEWLAIKEERRIQEMLFQLQTRAATRIQAWWRGTMVRKKLGPYRVKKGKKDDKKGKGKKGKKK